MPRVDYTANFERHRIADPHICHAGSFRTQDIGRTGYSKRIACVRASTGKWITQSLLIHNDEPLAMKRKLRKQASQMRSRFLRGR
jgi:hypothetical protein